jgi:plastocyanin
MTIDAVVGDKVEWWTKSPFHVNPHTVTECTDGSFTNCGASVSATNPIGDSGVIAGGASSNTLQYGPITFTDPGAYFYRCDIHPLTMRGRVLVNPVGTPSPGPPAVGGIVGLTAEDGTPAATATGDTGSGLWLIASAGVLALVISAGAASIWKRAARREARVEDRDFE